MRPTLTALRQVLSDITYGIDAGHAIRHGITPRPQRPHPTTTGGTPPQLPTSPWTWDRATMPSRN